MIKLTKDEQSAITWIRATRASVQRIYDMTMAQYHCGMPRHTWPKSVVIMAQRYEKVLRTLDKEIMRLEKGSKK